MYKHIDKVVDDSGICKTQILNRCNKGEIRYFTVGPGNDHILVKEEDVIDLMIKEPTLITG